MEPPQHASYKHEPKECPRCQAVFECKVGDVANCQCSEVAVTEATQNFLDKTQYDCLCKSCLAKINEMAVQAVHAKIPRRQELVEGLHYYRESGFWVFTEYYHMIRGYCCQSGCRHCAYGFKKASQQV